MRDLYLTLLEYLARGHNTDNHHLLAIAMLVYSYDPGLHPGLCVLSRVHLEVDARDGHARGPVCR